MPNQERKQLTESLTGDIIAQTPNARGILLSLLQCIKLPCFKIEKVVLSFLLPFQLWEDED